jgi:serine/threonine protein kinase/tetratricopeptide (TPR) repeat protein
MIGKTVSHYKVLSKLGEGGMGVVYKAEDLKLHRFVALKFLHPDLTRDEEAKARFIHEAQAAAALNHPHICTIHEIDEHEGQSFIAMEFIEGEGLKDRILRGPLPIDDLLSLTIQIGEGLHEAHEKGIVHRDIKPGNVMLTSRGQAKILDFGLARLGTHTKITKTDTTLGTAAYMSPEQATGKETDRRTDIWSLGVVLYEMVTGARPFAGEYEPAVVYSILHDNPEPVTSRRSNVPMELERIVGKALSKEASGRYPHVEDMLVDLRALRSETGSRVPSQPRETRGQREPNKLAIAGAALAAVVLIVLGLTILPRLFDSAPPPRTSPVTNGRKMIVVLPFENLGPPEDEYFANGTTDAITARLAGVSGLGIISRQSAMQYKKTAKSIRQIGSELGVDYILEGTVQRERPGDSTSRVRVIPQLIRVTDDTHVWAETYDENMTEVFRVQSDIAERVAAQLDVALLEPERRAIEKRPTANLAAYEDYLRGLDYYHRFFGGATDVELSVQLFRNAVTADPSFAEAWAGLALAYHELYWGLDRPGALALETEAAERAQEIAPDLPETHLALGKVAYARREYGKALEHFERAERLQPSGEAPRFIGVTLRRMGRWREARIRSEEVLELPSRATPLDWYDVGYTNTCLRRFDEAERNNDKSIELAPHAPGGYLGKAHALLARNGDVDGARQVMLDMSRQVILADIAQTELGQGVVWSAEARLFPDVFAAAFDAFESGPIERLRRVQPATIGTAHLARAMFFEVMGDGRSASARYDSAGAYFERLIRSNPQSAYVSVYHSNLGRAYAGLGRCDDGMREAEEGVRMMPISRDAVVGNELVSNLAEVCMMCGEYEKAIDQIETLLSVPSGMSVGLLSVDPIWDPIRSNPRFRRIVEGS